MKYRLKISDDVAFPCGFTLNEKGEPRAFGLLIEAKRAQQPDSTSGETIGQFLDGRAAIRMVGWVDNKSPLQDEAGNDVPAGADALAALYDLVPNMPGLVLTAYLDATGAKAKLGN